MTYSIFELNKFIESQSLNVPASVHLFSRSEVNDPSKWILNGIIYPKTLINI